MLTQNNPAAMASVGRQTTTSTYAHARNCGTSAELTIKRNGSFFSDASRRQYKCHLNKFQTRNQIIQTTVMFPENLMTIIYIY